jgi:YVTN family beta-propeller protein
LVGTLEKDHRGAAPKGNRGPWLGFLLTAILFLLPATSARAQMVTATVAAGAEARAAAVNPVANMIYAANSDSNTVTVIDGATNSTSTVTTGSNTLWVSVNPVTNKIYADNYDSNTVTVIDGATNSTSTVSAVNNP